MRGTLRWVRADLRARRGQALVTVVVVAGVAGQAVLEPAGHPAACGGFAAARQRRSRLPLGEVPPAGQHAGIGTGRYRDVLRRGRTAEGHVFNLGHGVLPETDPAVLARLTDLVHAESARPDT